MRWYVVSDGITSKVIELFSWDKSALMPDGFHIVCDKHGYSTFNDAFTSMIMNCVNEPAVEMLALP